ncbi:capsid cement protein [Micromonospora coerulea]|uniref:capsid cement protein n=1 Tax=Micromonospora coerulea TaxID=47856 RepID=UPI00190454A5|nr:capsid cement protein [Micromonospora veneta]
MPVASAWIVRHANHLHEGVENVYSGLTASATITADQVLAVTGSGTVGPAGAASAAVVGIAISGAASGAPVTMFAPGGVWSSTASGGITAGTKLVSGAAGTVATIGANTFEKIIGTALDTVSNGQTVRWTVTL